MEGKVLLVGSVPGKDAAEAMRTCGSGLGALVGCLPDGETGMRKIWINYLAATVYARHPSLEIVNRPHPVDPQDPGEWRQPGDDWVPRGYDDHWQFALKPGVRAVRFERLGYADEAAQSYAQFCKLRDDGFIAPRVRFMVAVPLTESAIRPFLPQAADFEPMWAAYEDAMRRELVRLGEVIPAHDLALQFDVCMEVIAVEVDDDFPALFRWKPAGTAFDRYLRALRGVVSAVPPGAWLGLHLCYGDLGHRHAIEPASLAVVTRMFNAARAAVSRPLDFVHVPVPRARHDDAYFAPLHHLELGSCKLYLGLIHHTDGAAGSLARLATAKRHAHGFGVATECGFGRRPADTIPELLRIHREVAAALD